MVATALPRPISIAILAMGGEGGGVLADWLVDLAEHQGYLAQATSVPGVAQRTGSTIYYLELFPPQPSGKAPVLALMPVPGEVDVVIASELMEAGRAVQRGLVTKDRTALIVSSHRVYSMTERTAMGDGRVDSSALLQTCRESAKTLVEHDFAQIAENHRSVISAALFGALAGAGVLPFERGDFQAAIRRGGIGVDSSLAAFDAGVGAKKIEARPTSQISKPKTGPRLALLAARIENEFPPEAEDILLAGIQRLADYQSESYAGQFLNQLQAVRAADDCKFAVLRETARYLALWMSYEDAVRVADLKIRRARFDRVRHEVKAETAQVLHINEFLHPGIQEIADILPEAFGAFLLNSNWAKRLVKIFTGEGRIVRTTSLSGYLQLYLIASLRPLRPRSLRFRVEQRKIREWLEPIPLLIKEDYALAQEYAECPRLIKGYGDTHALGSGNFAAIMNVLPRLRGREDAAPQLRSLREAALADERGTKLSEALKEVAV
jgi:indolepyruvate ferredoxin oxidoreductase, beta subunit